VIRNPLGLLHRVVADDIKDAIRKACRERAHLLPTGDEERVWRRVELEALGADVLDQVLATEPPIPDAVLDALLSERERAAWRQFAAHGYESRGIDWTLHGFESQHLGHVHMSSAKAKVRIWVESSGYLEAM
jgi:hypothetical protein